MGAPQAVGGTVSEAEGKSADAGKESAVATSVDPFETAKATAAAASSPLRQEVLVLRDGFQGWQGLYRVRVSPLSLFSLCSLFRAFLSLSCGLRWMLTPPLFSCVAQKDPDLVENFDVNVWQEYSP